MEHHKCSNTIWSGRDQGFWWDGVKGGFITAVIFTSVLWFDGMEMNSRYGRINFYISPKLLYEETGYLWKGEKR